MGYFDMATKLTGAYRTADGRFFERDDRDVARAHDAWLELLAWVLTKAPLVDDPDSKDYVKLARAMATDPELLDILKRKPQEAPPNQ